ESLSLLLGRVLPALDSAGLLRPGSLVDVGESLRLMRELEWLFELYSTELFATLESPQLLNDMTPASGSTIARSWSFLANSRYRRASGLAKSLRVSKRVAAEQLLEELTAADMLLKRWRQLAAEGSSPRPLVALKDLIAAWERAVDQVSRLGLV